jgi:hypothetical protein
MKLRRVACAVKWVRPALVGGQKAGRGAANPGVLGTVGTGLASTSILAIGAAAVFRPSAAASSNLLYAVATGLPVHGS